MHITRELIEEANNLFDLAQQVQDENLSLSEQAKKNLLDKLSGIYRAWYHRGLELFTTYGREDLAQKFTDEYDGSLVAHKIRKFLSLGWRPHKVAKWTTPYERSFKEPLQKQCDLLASLKIEKSVPELTIDALLVETICRRILYTARILSTRSRNEKLPFTVTDEYDVQDLLQGVLRACLKYSVQEDPLPKIAGTRSSRADISIEELGIIIEIKYAYNADDQKRIFDDFSKDLILYTAWSPLKILIFLIYNSAVLRDAESLEKLNGVIEMNNKRFETRLILA